MKIRFHTSMLSVIMIVHLYIKRLNHKDYNFLACDWFNEVLFSTNLLAKLLSDSLLSDSSTNQSNSEL